MRDKLFLLGGNDLEMLEIKKILQNIGVNFIDKNLFWGAKLSDYKDFLDFQGDIYGIELELDITLPKNYIEIDHHGENSDKPSSLEQVAEIFDIKLSRHQQLVCANDNRYISGMKTLCATNDEINNIRKKDREAQGITKKDEDLAEKSIQNSKNSNVVFSLTDKFSAISDMIYDKLDNYIIYNETTASFYGYKIQYVLNFLETKNIKKEKYFYGGGEFGFLGFKNGVLEKDELKNLIEEFDELQKQNNKIISYHTFMLPFIVEEKKTIIKGWDKSEYDVDYNEDAYFHNFFKNSMFKKNVEFYKKEEFKNQELTLTTSLKEYKLNIDSVNLRLFDTGIGILTINIENKTYQDVKSILEINDFTRRIYPEYLDEKKQCSLVPRCIKLKDTTENFKYEKFPLEPQLSKIIKLFLPELKPKNIVVDDRMFTVSFYENEKFAKELKNAYECHDDWYKYIFVDGNNLNVQNKSMQEELTKQATYARWQNDETMYGISRYSFVCLSRSDFPLQHMKTMYFSMFSLLLMVRATVLKFSNEVSEIANSIDDNKTADKVEDLYKRYIKFVNHFYFREITAKDQGLELYEKAMGILNIQRDIKDLDLEIEELHKFVEMKQEKESSETIKFLTYLGGALLPPSIITGFLGMNTLDGLRQYAWFDKADNGIWSISAVIISALIIPIYIKFKKGKK